MTLFPSRVAPQAIDPPLRPIDATDEPWPRRVAFWAVAAFVFTIPWEGVVSVQGVGQLSRAVGLLAVPIGAFAVIATGRRSRMLDVHLLMLAFAAWVVTSQLWAIWPEEATLRAVVSVQLVASVLLIWEFAQTPQRVLQLLVAAVAGAAVAAVLVVVAHFTGVEGSRLSASETSHPNDVAFIVCLAMPIAWHASLRCRNTLLRLLLQLYIPTGVFAIVLTASRSAILLVGVALIIVPWTLPVATRSTRVAITVMLATSVLIGPALLPEAQVERISTIASSFESGSFSGREQFWAASLEGLAERPVLGWGGGGSRALIRDAVGAEFGAHNTYLSVATDFGFIGLALFLLWLVAVGRHLLAASRTDRRFGLVLMATLLLGFMPRHWEYRKGTWLMIALLTAIAVIGTAVPRSEHLRRLEGTGDGASAES